MKLKLIPMFVLGMSIQKENPPVTSSPTGATKVSDRGGGVAASAVFSPNSV